MSRIKHLRQEKADLVNEGKALFEAAGDNDLNDEQVKRDDEINTRLGALDGEIKRAERALDRERELASAGATRAAGATNATGGSSLDMGDDPNISGGVDRAGLRPFASFGEQLQAIARAATGVERDPRLYQAKATGAGEAVGSDGGFLVQTDFAAEILRRMTEMGQVFSRVRRIPISANSNGMNIKAVKETSRATGSRWGGVQGYWVDEGVAATASRPKFREMELRLRKLAALGYATDELLADGVAMGAIFTEAFAEELLFLAEDSIINGTGAGMPQGILVGNALISVSKETGQAANTIVYENIVKMWARMWARSRANAVWVINQDVEPQLHTMAMAVGTGGVPVYLPAGGVSAAPFAQLMGRPVIPIEYCPTLGTLGDIMVLDLSQYMMIEKGGVQQASSIHVNFAKDETTFRAILRIDGQPIWESALTPFKGTNTLSPYVALAARA